MASGLLYGKHLVQPHFWVIFGTSTLNNSYNGLKDVFEQIISIAAAIENIYFAIQINKNIKLFYFIWEDLVHFNICIRMVRVKFLKKYRLF